MSRSLRFFAKGAFAALLAIHAITPAAASRTEKILYSFQGGSDGLEPDGWLTFDSAGNLYGTTLYGGVKGCTNNFGCGVVFKLTPDGVETVVYAFLGGTDGFDPQPGLLLDEAGNIYGAANGGSGCAGEGCGIIFRIAPDGTKTTLYSFQDGSDGAGPSGALTADKKGYLFGTAGGGAGHNCNGYGCGTVFMLKPSGKMKILYTFQGGGADDGYAPEGGLIRDKVGNLYGATFDGGSLNDNCVFGCGTVFKVTPAGTETLIFTFARQWQSAAYPLGGLTQDKQGNFYGVTTLGYGSVFKLGQDGTARALYQFLGGRDGNFPGGPVAVDKRHNVYGVTSAGGKYYPNCGIDRCGTVFKVLAAGKKETLYFFRGTPDAEDPSGGLIMDKAGNLYGTTLGGGTAGHGTVYEIIK